MKSSAISFSGPEFMARRPRASPLAWAWAAVALATLATAAVEAHQARGERQRAEQNLQQASARAAARPQAQALRARANVSAAAADGDGARVQAWALHSALGYPWQVLWPAVENASADAGVQLLRMEHSTGQAELLISGVASDPQRLRDFLKALGSQQMGESALFSDVIPTRQRRTLASTVPQLQFELRAKLATGPVAQPQVSR